MNAKGFTLIEILVAISLAGLIGVLVLSGLQASLSINEKTLNRSDLISQIALTDRIIKRDLLHALDRKARNERGDILDYPLYGESLIDEGVFLAFSIHTSSYADRALDSFKHSSIVLETVDSIDLRFFNQGSFVEVWPPQPRVGSSRLPQMIQISFKLKSYGDIFRSYLLTEGGGV